MPKGESSAKAKRGSWVKVGTEASYSSPVCPLVYTLVSMVSCVSMLTLAVLFGLFFTSTAAFLAGGAVVNWYTPFMLLSYYSISVM